MVLLLGGTYDSRKIAELLKAKNIDFIVSTVSEYGSKLIEKISGNVLKKALNEIELEELCKEKRIKFIVDATHPFAVTISQNAITVSKKLNIPYLRYERENIEITDDRKLIYKVSSPEEACKLALKLGNNILLTTGTRTLINFKKLFKTKNVFVRVLPELESLKKCYELGILPGQIIAIQGPFSKELNKVLIKEKKIDLLITKNSGIVGGTDTKIAACQELGIPIILINRPQLNYPYVTDDYFKVIDFLQEGNYELPN